MKETATTRKPMEFPMSYSHADLVQEYVGKQGNARHLKLPYVFSKYGSYEAREAIIDAFNACSNTILITNPDEECDEWEDLIFFLKKQASGSSKRNWSLFIKVLSGYLFRSGGLAKLRALRFAIGFTGIDYTMISGSDQAIAKLIVGCLKQRLFFESHPLDPETIALKTLFELNGLFCILREIKPLLQMMLECLFDDNDIKEIRLSPRIWYDSEDFIQVERALKIILAERAYDTDFLLFIEKMATAHKAYCRKIKENQFAPQKEKSAGPWFYDKNQAVLDSSVRLMRLAAKDNAKHGLARRQEVLKRYEK